MMIEEWKQIKLQFQHLGPFIKHKRKQVSTSLNNFNYFCFVFVFFLFLLFYQGETSKQPGERETPDDIFSLRAEVQKLGNIVAERERQQKESEELQKKMIEECEQMKERFQLILNTKSKYHIA